MSKKLKRQNPLSGAFGEAMTAGNFSADTFGISFRVKDSINPHWLVALTLDDYPLTY